MAIESKKTFDMLGNLPGRKFVISVMDIASGTKGKQVLQDMYSMFSSLGSFDFNNPISSTGKVSKEFLTQCEKFAQSAVELNKSRVDDPTSDYTKVDYFYMPMPSSIKETYTQNYEENRFSLEEKMFKKGLGAVGSLTDRLTPNISTMMTDLSGAIKNYMNRDNFLIDQNVISTYKGSNPREISLEFRIIPQDPDHAKRIINAIKVIKNYSRAERSPVNIVKSASSTAGESDSTAVSTDKTTAAPSTISAGGTASTEGGDVTIKAENMNIQFLSQKYLVTFQISIDKNAPEERSNHHKLNAVLSSKHLVSTLTSTNNEKEEGKLPSGASPVTDGYFLKNIMVDYGADGNMTTFNDGMPKQINMVITLTERLPMWADNYERNHKVLSAGSNVAFLASSR